MTLSNERDREALLTRLMADYDDALVSDTPTDVVDESVVEFDERLAHEWDEAKRCIDLLDRARRLAADAASVAGASVNTPAIPAAKHEFESTRRIGRFEIKRQLGRGGLGIVYLAHDPRLRRDVALKVPRFEALLDDALRRRFLREAEAAARLNHPRVVTLLEVGQDGPICYLTSEYCPGPTLAAWLDEQRQALPYRQAAALVAELADAVQHAHSRGVLHRDIKPSNVLLEAIAGANPAQELSAYSPKLTDFGVARLLEQGNQETRAGAIIGTLAYMSPEQAEGRIDELDARTDVYALGAVLYELLVGSPPYCGKSELETLRQLVAHEPASPRGLRSDVPRDLEAITLKCLARRASNRYATARELMLDLRRFLEGQPTAARSIRWPERVWKWAQRRPAAAAAMSVATVAVIATLGVVAIYNSRLVSSHARLETALDESRRLLYAADLQTGFGAWRHGTLSTAQERLERHLPAVGQPDLRTFPWHWLNQLCNEDRRELYRHPTKATAIACSPDEKWIASAELNGPIVLWDVAAERIATRLLGHTNDVYCLAFSPDSGALASASDDQTVRIWSVSDSSPPKVLGDAGNLAAYGVAYSPDGRLLAAAFEDAKVRVWDTRSWTLRHTFSEHTRPVKEVAFSGDGLRLASCGADASIWIRDVATGGNQVLCDGRKEKLDGLSHMALSHDGSRVAAANWTERIVGLWDASSSELLDRRRAADLAVQTMAFSPNGRRLVAGLRDGGVLMFDSQSVSTQRRLLGHRADVRDLAFSTDGSRLFTAGADGAVCSWDLSAIERWHTERKTEYPVEAIVFQQAGPLCAYLDSTSTVTLIDTRTGLTTLRIAGESVPGEIRTHLRCLAFSSDGRRLAYPAAEGREVHVCDLASQAIVARLDVGNERLSALAFAHEGDRILTASGASRLARWDIASGKRLVEVGAEQAELFAVVPLTRDNLLLTAGKNEVQLRDPQTLQVRHTLPPFTQPIRTLAISPDEKLLIAGSATGQLVVWDLTTRTHRTALGGHRWYVTSIAFCSDGATFVSCDGRSDALLWDAGAMQNVGSMSTGFQVSTLAFSPNGRTLAAGGGESMAFLSLGPTVAQPTAMVVYPPPTYASGPRASQAAGSPSLPKESAAR
jgi:WD40 repeat protein